MAEALVRHRLDAQGVAATVRSAGLLFDDRPAEPEAVAALAKRGIDLHGHRSAVVTPAMVERADLVIAMEQRHVRECAVLPGADFGRIFTFPDLVARAEQVGARGQEPFAGWVQRLAEGRTTADALRDRPDLEVIDPMGGSNRTFRTCAATLDDLAARFVALAWSGSTPQDQPALANHPTPGSI
jgi:protein-tyrosine-phosphatase